MIQSKITPRINNFIDNPDCDSLTEMINFMVKYNVISIDISDIFYGRKNLNKFLLCLLNCFYLWLTLFIFILFIRFDEMKKLFMNPLIPNDQINFIFLLVISYYILICIFKTDLLIDEYRNNLNRFQFLYYLVQNDKSIHKLTNFNYKKLRRKIDLINIIFLKITYPIVVSSVLIAFLAVITLTESIVIKLTFPFTLYTTITFNATSYSSLSIIYSLLYYHQIRFKQINHQFKILSKIRIISNVKFINLIKEHNQISVEIFKFNLLMKKSIALVFITSSMAIDFLIYLSFYSQSIYYKIFFQFFAILICLIYVSLIVNIIKVTNSAHQCYNHICSLVIQRKLSYRIRFKVISI